MNDLYIVGAGGFGREVLQWAKDVNRKECRWNIKGFLSDDLDILAGKACDFSVVGKVDGWIPREGDEYLLAIGNPKTKERIVEKMRDVGAHFVKLIHPTAQVSQFVSIGCGTIVCPNAEISPNVNVGEFCTILNAGIGHDCSIGDYCTVSGGSYINGGCHVGDRVFFGSGSLIVPGKKIDMDAHIGIGSVVIRNVKAGSTVFGNPAKAIGF